MMIDGLCYSFPGVAPDLEFLALGSCIYLSDLRFNPKSFLTRLSISDLACTVLVEGGHCWTKPPATHESLLPEVAILLGQDLSIHSFENMLSFCDRASSSCVHALRGCVWRNQ
jgi:hypothetical protein